MNNKWTEGELQFLKDNYAEYGSLYISSITGRSRKAVTRVAGRLGIKALHRIPQPSTDPDDEPFKTMDYGDGISITWTRGEWRRLQEVLPMRDERLLHPEDPPPWKVSSSTYIYFPT